MVPQLPADTTVVEETSFAAVILVVLVVAELTAKMEYRSSSPAARFVVPLIVNISPASWSLTGFIWIEGDLFTIVGHDITVGVTDGSERIRISRDIPQSETIR